MVKNKIEKTAEDAEVEPEAEAPPAADADKDVDKVKPVVFIGLFITALLGLGKHTEYVFNITRLMPRV